MKNRIKKFYNDHEAVIVASCLGFCAGVVIATKLVDDANYITEVRGHKDDKYSRIMIVKKNGSKRYFHLPVDES